MTREVKARAARWLDRCTSDASIFDWFAAFCEVCSCQGVAVDAVRNKAGVQQAAALLSRAHGAGLAEALDRDIGSVPPSVSIALRTELASVASCPGAVSATELETVLGWIVLIDRLFLGLGATLLSDPSERVWKARARLKELGTLTTEPSWGLVLPKAMSGEYGQSVSRLCRALASIDLVAYCESSYTWVDDQGGSEEIPTLRVGVVAVVHGASELAWQFEDSDSGPVYTVQLSPTVEIAVVQRVLAALDALKDRAHLVVLPELVSSPALIEEIQRWLERNRDEGRLLPIAVLAGTYLDDSEARPPRNMAVVLDGHGRDRLRQYKLNPYKLTPDHRRGLDLPGADSSTAYVEDIRSSPHRVAVMDITGLGRIVVTICEDTDRWRPWRHAILEMGPSLCLSPIMNGPGEAKWAWVQRDAIEIANEAGSSVIVANSGAMMSSPGASTDYAFAAFPRDSSGNVVTWRLVDSAAPDSGGQVDWWMYEGPSWPPTNGT